jgi:hypothetical protein
MAGWKVGATAAGFWTWLAFLRAGRERSGDKGSVDRSSLQAREPWGDSCVLCNLVGGGGEGKSVGCS